MFSSNLLQKAGCAERAIEMHPLALAAAIALEGVLVSFETACLAFSSFGHLGRWWQLCRTSIEAALVVGSGWWQVGSHLLSVSLIGTNW